MKNKKILAALAAAGVALSLAACGGGSTDKPDKPAASSAQSTEDAAAAAEKAAADAAAAEEKRIADEAAAAAEAARIGTPAQQNAYNQAGSYLSHMSFSRSGLAGQLEFEGYSPADAEFAIARVEAEGGVDWNAQAAAQAASYLSNMSFSRSGLVDQLLFEGYTPEQAEYGVSTTGL